jgi:hypothetical protein
MTRVGRVRFAGRDLYGGAVGRVAANDDVEAHPVEFDGPLPGPFGLFAEALHVAFFLERRPESNVVSSYRRRRHEVVRRAQRLLDGEARAGTLQEATAMLQEHA